MQNISHFEGSDDIKEYKADVAIRLFIPFILVLSQIKPQMFKPPFTELV